jgi:hypothetical protein
LGPIHHGRKPEHLQPSRVELRTYHKQVEPLLNFPVLWLNDATRQVVAEAFRKVVREQKYTCYACAILKNHAHLVIRRHRDTYQAMFTKLTAASAEALRSCSLLQLEENHPVFSQRPYSAYCYTSQDIRGRIEYVEANPEKEGLRAQRFDFVTPYDNWPQHSPGR